MAALVKYTGWGGLSSVFRSDHPYYDQVKELLTNEEYQSARSSTTTAFYTPPGVVSAVWDMVERMGFKGGNVLEPSAGTGHFFGLMPEGIKGKSSLTGVEIDRISGLILKALYPDAKVRIEGFEEQQIQNNSLDLVVTNVPFMDVKVHDTFDKDLSKRFNIHDYFIAKSIRKLKPGGLGVFITTTSTLDKSKDLRNWIVTDGNADFIDAPNLPDHPESKLNTSVKIVLDDLEETKDYNGTVAVFCDAYQSADRRFNVFNEIKQKLIDQGVPAEQIAIINDYKSDDKKAALFEKVNKGDVRVIMGTTEKLGVGVNIQERLHALIHLDAPTRPSDYQQRNGRIMRQGNLHLKMDKTIKIYRIGVKQTLDVTGYQRLEIKKRFIDQIMKGDISHRTLEEVDLEGSDSSNFSEFMATLSGSMSALALSMLKNKLRKLQNARQYYYQHQVYITSQLRDDKLFIETLRNDIAEIAGIRDRIKAVFPEGRFTSLQIGNTEVTTAEETEELINKTIVKRVTAEADVLRDDFNRTESSISTVLKINGKEFSFQIHLNRSYDALSNKTRVNRTTNWHSVDLPELKGTEDGANISRVVDRISRNITLKPYNDNIANKQERLDDYEKSIESLEKQKGQPFEKQQELDDAIAKVAELEAKMQEELAALEAEEGKNNVEAFNVSGAIIEDGEVQSNKDDDETDYRMTDASTGSATDVTTKLNNLAIAREMEEARQEKKARIEKLRNSAPIEISGEEYKGKYELNRSSAKQYIKDHLRDDYINKDTGDEIELSKVGANEVTSHGERDDAHLKSIAAIPRLIEDSIFIEEQRNQKDHGKYDSYRYYVVGIKIGGVDYTAKVVIGVKGNKKYYDHRLTEIEKGKLLNNLNGLSNTVADQQPTLSGIKDIKLIRILQIPDTKSIRLATGWEKGVDGEWRYEEPTDNPNIEEVRTKLESLVSRAKNAGTVHIVDAVTDIPQEFRIKAKGRLFGLFDPKTMESYFIAGHITDAEQAVKVWIHEVGVHKGLRNILPADRLNPLLSKLFSDLGKDEIQSKIPSVYHAMSEARQAQEYLAFLAEQTLNESDLTEQKRSAWNRFVDGVKRILNRIFSFNQRFTQEDAERLVREAVKLVYTDDPRPTPFLTDYLRMVKQNRGIADHEPLFKQGDKPAFVTDFLKKVTRRYNRDKKIKRERQEVINGIREFFQDHDLPIMQLEKAVAQRGGTQNDSTRPYRDMSLSYGRLETLHKEYTDNKMVPILETINEIGKAGLDKAAILPYIIAKHTPELNAYFRKKYFNEWWDQHKADYAKWWEGHQNSTKDQQDAMWAKLEAIKDQKYEQIQKTDYAGIMALDVDNAFHGNPDALANAIVDEIESQIPQELTDKLWRQINEANQETIKAWYLGRRISLDEAMDYATRYKYFVPLRGWRDGAAQQLRYVQGQGFGKSLQHAEGRKTLADNPLSHMAKVTFQAMNEYLPARLLRMDKEEPEEIDISFEQVEQIRQRLIRLAQKETAESH